MRYYVSKLKREVELDDELVNLFQEYSILRDGPFVLAAIGHCGHLPEVHEISDEELSNLCNLAMASELKALNMIPKALEYINSHYDDWTNGELTEVEI